MDDKEVNVNELYSKIKALLPVATSVEQAEEEVRNLQEQVLQKILNTILPLVPFLGKRPTRKETEETVSHFPWRGIFLAGDEEPVPRCNGNDENRGEYRGRGLWLSHWGKLYELVHSGEFSRWQGEAGFSSSEETSLSVAEALKNGWRLNAILTRLVEHIALAETKLPERVKAAALTIARLQTALTISEEQRNK